MKTKTQKWLIIGGIIILVLLVFYFGWQKYWASQPIDKKGFQKIALGAECADLKNQLYIINDRYVFWEKRGDCSDASYSYTLYDKSPKMLVCSQSDNIRGTMTFCTSFGKRAFFEKLIANSEKENLGLDQNYTVGLLPIVEIYPSPENATSQAGKNYQNNVLGVDLTLPASFHVGDGVDEKTINFIAVNYDETKLDRTDPAYIEMTPPGVRFSIGSQQKEPGFSLLEIAGQMVGAGENSPSVSFENVKVGGYDGLKYDQVVNDKEAREYIIVGVKDKIYVLYTRADKTAFDAAKNDLGQIINSVKFL